MRKILSRFEGDKAIWAYVVLLALFSFMPVFSASTNLAYVVGNGSVTGILTKHMMHICVGIIIIFLTHRIAFKHIKVFAPIAWIPVVALLVITAFQGSTIGGADANRWMQIPIVGMSFQPSSIGWITLLAFIAWYLYRFADEDYKMLGSPYWVWLPVMLVLLPIFPSNLSTAAIIFVMVVMMLYVGGYPKKYLFKVGGIAMLIGVLFYLSIKAYPEAMPSRFNTWTARIERFGNNDEDVDRYQIDNAKIAFAQGNILGLGPGKSIQKNFLPQSSSDFIYAIIGEEFGYVGASMVLLFYVLLFFRFLIVSKNAPDLFSKYLAVGLGFSIIFQAIINMGVAVEIFPTTGQPLPLISSGGTAIWMTCFSIGLILNISRKEQEIKKQLKEKEEKELRFKQILEEQEQNEYTDLEDNPMNAVLNK